MDCVYIMVCILEAAMQAWHMFVCVCVCVCAWTFGINVFEDSKAVFELFCWHLFCVW